MKILFLLLLFLGALRNPAASQTALFDTSRYTFVASFILPRNAPSVLLNGGRYELRVAPDSLSCDLPYRGGVYVTPVHPDSAGILFGSAYFSKQTVPRKKGWRITLRPRDQREQYQLLLDVGRNGFATLQVFSNRRDAVRFDGYIEELRRQ